ncbi:MAG: creatininase family protein, partial [Methyloligellaceae bacterium]
MSYVGGMTWDAVGDRLEAGAAALLPIGAGAKEHGFHLPMNTDQLQAEWLAARIAERFDVLIWPTLSYGHYPAFVNYAGSCSLSADTFGRMVRELAEGLLGFGARAVLVLDTGVSTLRPVARALTPLFEEGAVHLKIHDGPRYGAVMARLGEQAYGSHADEFETARMLAMAPEQLVMARAEASPANAVFQEGPMTPHDPGAPNYSRSGSFGDPTLATPEKGEALL